MDDLLIFGLLVLLVFLPLLVIIVLIRQSKIRDRLSGEINSLLKLVGGLEKQIQKLQQGPPIDILPKPAPTPETPKPAEKPVSPVPPVPPVVRPTPVEPTLPELQPVFPEATAEEPIRKRTYIEELHERQTRAAVEPPKPAIPQESWWDKWVRNNPDLEKFIGENLANKIGIAVLVLGIGFFVKYAIDKDWIKEGGRIAIGLICGGILVGIAHYMRNTYRSFSSVLVGGGLCVFYFTIAFAYQEYGMMPQAVAFGSMVIITAFAVALALLYNRLEIAVLATIGGFVTPFLVSNGSANYVALFTYLAILNTGLLVLAYFKRWPSINIIALFFTVIIFGSWLGIYGDTPGFSNKGAFFFATLFYALFIATNTLNNLREKRVFSAFDFGILFSINALYYSAGILILKDIDGGVYKGLFTAILGVLNLTMAYLLFKNKRADKNFIYLLIGLTLTYISLAAPVQLNGNSITLFWASECVVLYWLYRRSGIALLKVASLIISGLAFVSLMMDLEKLYGGSVLLPVITNRAFITTIVVAVAYGLLYTQVKKQGEKDYFTGLPSKTITTVLLVLTTGLLYAAGALEIWFQLWQRMPGTGAVFIYLQLYTYCFALALLLLVLPRFTTNQFVLRNTILSACFALYLLYISAIGQAAETALAQGTTGLFAGHWLADIALLALAFNAVQYVRKNNLALAGFLSAFTWIISIALLIFISVEVYYLFLWAGYNGTPQSIERYKIIYNKAGITITWAVVSFTFMWLGMQYRYKPLRVISLSLFLLALIKLFLWDIRNIGEGGKIAAFIALGVLLLIISFMYQRLKKLFANDEVAGK